MLDLQLVRSRCLKYRHLKLFHLVWLLGDGRLGSRTICLNDVIRSLHSFISVFCVLDGSHYFTVDDDLFLIQMNFLGQTKLLILH